MQMVLDYYNYWAYIILMTYTTAAGESTGISRSIQSAKTSSNSLRNYAGMSCDCLPT